MKDCVFCKIISGEIPCHKIYEDDFVLAFLDSANEGYGHTLVVPKRHFDNILTCDNPTFIRVMQTVRKIGNHLVKDCGFDGFNVFTNCGKCADQSVMHLHFHIVPRKVKDGLVVSTKMTGIGKVDKSGKKIEIIADENKTDLAKVCKKLKFDEEKKDPVDDENQVVMFTDGACSGNPGLGGWAAILSHKGREKILSGGEEDATNNRMELLAVIKGLESIKDNFTVQVFTDSAYVVNAFEQNWLEKWQKHRWKTSDKTKVQNQDLWQRLLAQTERLDVHFNKVKGHSTNSQNNRCDTLAREEIKKMQD